jgi:mannose-6-phosphate isomerase-like protein (cupin superfamily)
MDKQHPAFFVHESIPSHGIPGITHRTLASRGRGGLQGTEVWLQTMDAGCGTPVHRHDCDEVVTILRGRARVTIEGKSTELSAGSTVVIPPDVVHDIQSIGEEPLEAMATLAMAPVRVTAPDGTPMPLPWGE